ncbi:ClbS/DfsB family four-helix bundle protein [Gorillibacterium sp. sgz500922]|uniref:ClbS/DfsB family four-helix bundle protein n=1 Tax=Gorillibacterium sp. sgz500922 TaxID=3446694 RepID=UPI003F6610C9
MEEADIDLRFPDAGYARIGYKWNQLGELYRSFYEAYGERSLAELKEEFQVTVAAVLVWLGEFAEEDLFRPGGRIKAGIRMSLGEWK